jgi:uncharacterized protein (DUF1778 family)
MAAHPKFNGRLQVVVKPSDHRKIYKYARYNGEHMTDFMARAIRDAIAAFEKILNSPNSGSMARKGEK